MHLVFACTRARSGAAVWEVLAGLVYALIKHLFASATRPRAWWRCLGTGHLPVPGSCARITAWVSAEAAGRGCCSSTVWHANSRGHDLATGR